MGAVHSSSKCPFILYSKQIKHQAITMAPVEIDHDPKSIIAPVKNMKVVDKAMSLPLVSSAYSEVSRVTSPYMESTMNKVSPVVENTLGMVSPVVDSVKTKVEEQILPHIPAKVSEALLSVQEAAVGQVTTAVEKADTIACGGIDQLTEKVPQLKDATPKLIEETKTSLTSFVIRWSEYFASFSAALVLLKVMDASLDRVETALEKIGSDNAKTLSSMVQMMHSTANTLRLGAVKSAGTPLAQKIEESSVIVAMGEVSRYGLHGLLERLGLVSRAVTEAEEEGEVEGMATSQETKETTAEISSVKKSKPEATSETLTVTKSHPVSQAAKSEIVEEALDVASEVTKLEEASKISPKEKNVTKISPKKTRKTPSPLDQFFK